MSCWLDTGECFIHTSAILQLDWRSEAARFLVKAFLIDGTSKPLRPFFSQAEAVAYMHLLIDAITRMERQGGGIVDIRTIAMPDQQPDPSP